MEMNSNNVKNDFWVDLAMNRKGDLDLKGDPCDELAELLREPKQNNRQDIWLWLRLYWYEKADLDPATCNGTTMRSAIARFLMRRTALVKEISREKDRFLVPDDCLKWVAGDERQYQWLIGRVKSVTASNLPRGLVHLRGRNRLIAMLDIWDVEIAKKADEIEYLRKQWLRHRAKDGDFEWFEDKKDGSQRCKCAWEWLQKNRLPHLSQHPPISNYQELLIFFDQADYGPTDQKAIIKEIKQRWSRKQHGERTVAAGKKQVNVELSKSVISLLDELAKKHELKRPQVLELLIKMESERGMIEKALTRHATTATQSSHSAQESRTDTHESPIDRMTSVDSELHRVLDTETLPGIDIALTTINSAQIDIHSADTCTEAALHNNASSHLEKDMPHPDPQTAEEDLLDQRPRVSAGISLRGLKKPRKKNSFIQSPTQNHD